MNDETMTINMWINNDYGIYNDVKTMVLKATEVRELANNLKTYFNEINPLADDASPFADLLMHALRKVDWYEMASLYLEAVEDFKED